MSTLDDTVIEYVETEEKNVVECDENGDNAAIEEDEEPVSEASI